MYFMNVPEAQTAKNRLHVDLGTDSALDDEVARLIGLGATLVELRQDPPTLANPDTWAVMADPEGNVFCVLNTASVSGIF